MKYSVVLLVTLCGELLLKILRIYLLRCSEKWQVASLMKVILSNKCRMSFPYNETN
jgi:hypothetical protein